MSEIYLYFNGKLLDTYSGENTKKVVSLLKKAAKFEVIVDNDNGIYLFEVKLAETDWKLKKGL